MKEQTVLASAISTADQPIQLTVNVEVQKSDETTILLSSDL